VKRTTFFAAFVCALLISSLLGCGAVQGTTNHLLSIQLSTSNAAAAPPGTLNLQGIGGTIQVYTWGNYSSGKQLLLDSRNVTYHIAVDADSPLAVDPSNGMTYLLANPPQTVALSPTGLLTAVDPSACTWFNSAVAPASAPAWSMVGAYTVTATYSGFTSPPVFVAVASAPGVFNAATNKTGQCGP
jgi:hypothetical protein